VACGDSHLPVVQAGNLEALLSELRRVHGLWTITNTLVCAVRSVR